MLAQKGSRRTGAIGRAGIAASFAIPFTFLALYWVKSIARSYFPYGDDFALIVSSTRPFHPSIRSWFVDGYSKYLLAYPEWTVPYTDFIRPVANLSYYANSLLFGRHWSFYLLLTYAVQSGLVAACVAVAVRRLRMPASYAIAAGCFCFVSPAFGTQALFEPSFAFDLLAALFVIMGINQYLKRNLLAAFAFFSLAVFTKETALFAPAVAAGLALLDTNNGRSSNRLRLSLMYLVPIAAWGVLRMAAFHGMKGVYVFHNNHPGQESHTSTRLLIALSTWPIAMRDIAQPAVLAIYFAVFNWIFWAFAVAALLQLASSRPSRRRVLVTGASAFGFGSLERQQLFAFCVASLFVPCFLNLPQRFGASFYPLFGLAALCAAHRARIRWFRISAGAMLLLSFSAVIFQRFTLPDSLKLEKMRWALASDFVGRLGQASASEVFVLDDFTDMYASPNLVSRFAGYRGKLTLLSAMETSTTPCEGSPAVRASRVAPDSYRLTSALPGECGAYYFYGADQKILASADRRPIERADGATLIHYQIPPLGISPSTRLPSRFGTMTIDISNGSADAILLYPDMSAGRYRDLELTSLR